MVFVEDSCPQSTQTGKDKNQRFVFNNKYIISLADFN
jgi:hypothetical protein